MVSKEDSCIISPTKDLKSYTVLYLFSNVQRKIIIHTFYLDNRDMDFVLDSDIIKLFSKRVKNCY